MESKMKKIAMTKRQMLTEFRALLNAIEATTEPDRIAKHLNEIRLKSTRMGKAEIIHNPYWINN